MSDKSVQEELIKLRAWNDKLLAEVQNWQHCEECNTPLSACGEQNPDGTPSMDCLVCQLRAERDTLRKERNELAVKLESTRDLRQRFAILKDERDHGIANEPLRDRIAELEQALGRIATDSAVSSLQSNPVLNPRHIARAALTRTPDGKEQK